MNARTTTTQVSMLAMALGASLGCASSGSAGSGGGAGRADAGAPGGTGGPHHPDGAAGQGGSGAGAGGQAGCDSLDFQAFDATVSSFIAAKGLEGASGVVVHRDCGVVHTQGYGSYAPDRIYLVGSASKVVTVGVLMRLADAGVLDLDAPLGRYLSAWEPNGKPELTLAQLMSNSSGLVGLVDNPLYRPYACQYRDAGSLADCARAIFTADDAATRVPPDTSFHYGGGQWQLAGGVAEVASGKRWTDLVAETYGTPCGMVSFGYTNQFAKAAQSGSGLGGALSYPAFFDGDPAALPVTANPSMEGGLFATAGDYGKLLLMHLRGGTCDGGRVVSEAAVARMQIDRILQVYGGSTAGQTGRTAGGSGGGALEGYGMGWWIDRSHPGVFADPGLYGAFPWIDVPRGYGALVAIEADGDVGAELWATAKPALDHAFDAALGRR
jgi:CubicO group peptidase (beta-lactamase class C family)